MAAWANWIPGWGGRYVCEVAESRTESYALMSKSTASVQVEILYPDKEEAVSRILSDGYCPMAPWMKAVSVHVTPRAFESTGNTGNAYPYQFAYLTINYESMVEIATSVMDSTEFITLPPEQLYWSKDDEVEINTKRPIDTRQQLAFQRNGITISKTFNGLLDGIPKWMLWQSNSINKVPFYDEYTDETYPEYRCKWSFSDGKGNTLYDPLVSANRMTSNSCTVQISIMQRGWDTFFDAQQGKFLKIFRENGKQFWPFEPMVWSDF